MGTIIFDMDGVLVDSMPLHYKAMKIAIKEIASIDG
jgi:beta-phosphoglucomutase-like phosphatase (HAD superfamily)